MKESQFGFSYSWSDLQPVRALTITVGAAQVLGAFVGLAVPRFNDWLEGLWFGAAIATFPAFLVGLVIQAHLKPGSLSENIVMVRRLGLIAAFLTAIAVAMSIIGFGRVG